MVGTLEESHPPFKRDPAGIEARVKHVVDVNYDVAKQSLGEAEVRSASREQVVGIYLVREYHQATMGLWKTFGLPYPRAQQEMLRFWDELAVQRPPASENPLIQADLVSGGPPVDYRIPTVLRIRNNLERVDRYVALLRVIESLRDYAAGHDGRPLERLEDVTGLPVPADPMTGRGFGYEVKGNVVILDATPPKPFGVFSGWRYELTFVK
jgi:hypothetical protein